MDTISKKNNRNIDFSISAIAVIIVSYPIISRISVASKINQVHRTDKENITHRFSNTSRISIHASSISRYVERLRNIDTSECPMDFQAAFATHVNA